MKKTTTAESVWDKVTALRPTRPVIPEYAFNRRQYMQKFNLTEKQADKELGDAVSCGGIVTALGHGANNCVERKYWPL